VHPAAHSIAARSAAFAVAGWQSGIFLGQPQKLTAYRQVDLRRFELMPNAHAYDPDPWQSKSACVSPP